MKKLIVVLVTLVCLATAFADVYLTGWFWDRPTESIVVNVTASEPWVVYRSFDTVTWTKVASMKKHQTQFVDYGVATNRWVYYSVQSVIKPGGNPNKPRLAWEWSFMWERQYSPE